MCPFWVLVGGVAVAEALVMSGSRISMVAGFEPMLLPRAGVVRPKRVGRLARMLSLVTRR